MKNLLGYSNKQLQEELKTLPQYASFRIQQLWDWIYKKGIQSFNEMSNLPKEFVKLLSEQYSVARPALRIEQCSTDGTKKWLLKLEDGNEIEVVFIPEKDRGTLCISSQVGCTLNCSFCHTGTQTLVRNLTAGELLGQILFARDRLKDWCPEEGLSHIITNVVLMGMGEPLYNYDNLREAMNILMDSKGMNFGKRRITLSTSGIIPYINQCADELGLNLAISLHAVHNELRNELVPINKKYPLEDLIASCKAYAQKTSNRKITFEYVMLKDVNDSLNDARKLIQLIRGIPAKINLIPFNPWPGSPYETSSQKAIAAFASEIEKAGYMSPIRTPRGNDILAACGQLKSASQRPVKHKVE
jgi:23S rRNA (adenine2503-C2)-methyltransferase